MRHPVRFAALLTVLVAAGGATAVLGARLLGHPGAAWEGEAPGPRASLHVQQALAELLMRQGGVSRRADPVILTTPDLNAFLDRHIGGRRVTLRPLLVRAEDGSLEVAGRTSIRGLLAGSVVEGLVEVLPEGLLGTDIWLSARGRLVVRDGQGEFLVEEARLGRQPVPAAWLWRILGVHPREVLVWRLPHVVERIEVQRGRLLVHTRRAGG